MGTTSEAPSDLGALLAAFDANRDAYVALMRRVPDADVGFLEPGDDYSVGGIAVHVNYVFDHYLGLLATMRSGDFAECRAEDPPGLAERARARAGMSLTRAEVDAELERTRELHGELRAAIERLGDDRERKAPVFFGAAPEAYPTSALDILGWVSGHYDEHVPQVEALIAESGDGGRLQGNVKG